jgi:hypothetical protein
MIKEAIEKIEELVDAKEVMVDFDDGRRYSTRPLTLIPTPKPSSLCVHTLAGIVDYLKAEPDGCLVDNELAFIAVVNHSTASILSGLREPEQYRKHYVCATAAECEFPFGRFLPLEDFVIQSQAWFTTTGDLEMMLAHVGSIVDEDVSTIADDGVSQNVTRRVGLGRVGQAAMRPIVMLAPYRTFRELDQPVSRFLLRLKKVDGDLPQAGLWEADGSGWKLEAIKSIRDYLTAALSDAKIECPIIA